MYLYKFRREEGIVVGGQRSVGLLSTTRGCVMLKLPPPPQTFTTRQINCVVCSEQFTVSADSPFRVQRPAVWGQPRRGSPATGNSARSNTARPENNSELINCPRCGADNRNWLYILMPHDPHAVSTFLSRAENKVRRAGLRFSLAVGGILVIFLLLMPITLWLGLAGGLDIGRIGIVLVFMGMAAVVPAAVLTTEWRHLRLERHLREIMPPHRSVKQQMRVQGLALFALFTLIFPLLAVLIVPAGLDKLTDILSPLPPSLSQKTEEFGRVFNGLEQDFEGFSAAVATAKAQDESGEIAGVWQQIASANDETLAAIKGAREDLEAAVAEEESAIEEQGASLENAAEAEAVSNWKYFVFWLITVGLALFIAVLTALIAVESFVVSIDAQLPRPIFRRIANMMELALEELKESVGLNDDDIARVQWVKVQHNPQGGIDMRGIAHRSAVVDGNNSEQGTTLVRHYFIRTDMWGWILETDIKEDGRPIYATHDRTAPSMNHRSRQRDAAF